MYLTEQKGIALIDDFQKTRIVYRRCCCTFSFLTTIFLLCLGAIYLSNIELALWYAAGNTAVALTTTVTQQAPPQGFYLGVTSPGVMTDTFFLQV